MNRLRYITSLNLRSLRAKLVRKYSEQTIDGVKKSMYGKGVMGCLYVKDKETASLVTHIWNIRPRHLVLPTTSLVILGI